MGCRAGWKESLGRQSRLGLVVKTVEAREAGALDRYREPIWTAGLQSVVLPWITPSGRRAGGGGRRFERRAGRRGQRIGRFTSWAGARRTDCLEVGDGEMDGWQMADGRWLADR